MKALFIGGTGTISMGIVRRLAAEDVPVPFSAVLEKGVLPDEEKIAAAVREEAG